MTKSDGSKPETTSSAVSQKPPKRAKNQPRRAKKKVKLTKPPSAPTPPASHEPSSTGLASSKRGGIVHNLHLPEVLVYVVGALVPVLKWFLDGRPPEMVATESVWLFFVCQGVVTVFTAVMSLLRRPAGTGMLDITKCEMLQVYSWTYGIACAVWTVLIGTVAVLNGGASWSDILRFDSVGLYGLALLGGLGACLGMLLSGFVVLPLLYILVSLLPDSWQHRMRESDEPTDKSRGELGFMGLIVITIAGFSTAVTMSMYDVVVGSGLEHRYTDSQRQRNSEGGQVIQKWLTGQGNLAWTITAWVMLVGLVLSVRGYMRAQNAREHEEYLRWKAGAEASKVKMTKPKVTKSKTKTPEEKAKPPSS